MGRCSTPANIRSLILSPLDNGFFGVFKRKLQLEMETGSATINSPHFKASLRAYSSISSDTMVNFFKKCGLIDEESLSSIRETFKNQTQKLAEDEDKVSLEMLKKWAIGELNIQSVKAQRHYNEYPPNKDNEDKLDGFYWFSWSNTFDD
jgi:hypothetical protein